MTCELTIVDGPGIHLRYPLTTQRQALGRLDGGQRPPLRDDLILFPDESVARLHATLEWDARQQRFLLTPRDLTVVNNRTLTGPSHLNVGDQIQLGAMVLEFREIPEPQLF